MIPAWLFLGFVGFAVVLAGWIVAAGLKDIRNRKKRKSS